MRDALEYTREIQREFRRLDRLYLWANTFQWAAAVGLLAATLHAWRRSDAQEGGPP